MRVFISQPMTGRTEKEILKERQLIADILKKEHGEDIEIIDSYEKSNENPIALLGRAIEKMAQADLIAFMPGWDKSKGCAVEHKCSIKYGINAEYFTADDLAEEYKRKATRDLAAYGKADFEPFMEGESITNKESVIHPEHYQSCSIECIDNMILLFGATYTLYFCEMNAYKYLYRHKFKNGKEDIKKALNYLGMAERISNEQDFSTPCLHQELYRQCVAAKKEYQRQGDKDA